MIHGGPRAFPRGRRRIAAWAAIPALACLLAACGSSTAAPLKPGPLRWAPPKLSDPQTIHVGQGYTDLELDPTRDYVIDLPAGDKRGGLTIEGGHDIVLVGGHITVRGHAPPGHAYDRFRTGVYVKGATGTVQIEGVLFDAAPGIEWDAIDIAAPRATVQIENVRMERIRGRFSAFHADAVQPWGGVRRLRIDRLTASSNYQGITIPIDEGPIGSAQISNVDLVGLSRGIDLGGHLLWLTSGSETCDSYPVELRHVYVEPRRGLDLGESVWPQRNLPPACAARVRDGVASWPRLHSVRGRVRLGAPPAGQFVPKGSVGAGYETLGYRGVGG